MTSEDPDARAREDTASWPAGVPFDESIAVAAACDGCGLGWRVHPSLAGFRLRCRCGAWVAVAGPAHRELPGASAAHALAAAEANELASDDALAAPLAPPPGEFAKMTAWDGGPMRPDKDGAWTLRHASVEDRARWTSRTVLELVLTMACFLVPGTALWFATSGEQRMLLMPLASVVACLLVLGVSTSWRGRAFEGLRGAAPRHFAEAAGVALVGGLLAIGYVTLLERAFPKVHDDTSDAVRSWGLPLSLFIVSALPGFFEELAFRGLIQARLGALLGTVQGALVGGAAFALAHGLTLGLPFHWGLGAYLSFLRLRSGSLVPGMLCHALYNATIVLWYWAS